MNQLLETTHERHMGRAGDAICLATSEDVALQKAANSISSIKLPAD